MQRFFYFLAIVGFLAGFIFPPLWAGAIIALILALASAPRGTRPDGKRKNSGLLGGLIDSASVQHTMAPCPFCRELAFRNATVCPHCQRDIPLNPPAKNDWKWHIFGSRI
jgi:hypothetical protein